MRAVFEGPDWAALSEQGLMAVDMHFHTSCSDSFTDPVAALRLAASRGVGVAFTDHNLITSLIRFKGRDLPVPLIPGMEVSTSDGPHILAYFYDLNDLERFWYRCIRPRLQECPWLALRDCPAERLLDMLERENCVVSAAHPMGYFGSNKGVEICIRRGFLNEGIVSRLDAYEVICSGMTRESNLQSLSSARRYGIGFTGGTDGHTLGEVGNVVTVSDATDIDSFLDDVRRHRVDVIGLEKTVPDKVRMASASLARFMMHSPSAIKVQTAQAVISADRGARRAAESVRDATNGMMETAREAGDGLDSMLRELGKRRRAHSCSSSSSCFLAMYFLAWNSSMIPAAISRTITCCHSSRLLGTRRMIAESMTITIR